MRRRLRRYLFAAGTLNTIITWSLTLSGQERISAFGTKVQPRYADGTPGT